MELHAPAVLAHGNGPAAHWTHCCRGPQLNDSPKQLVCTPAILTSILDADERPASRSWRYPLGRWPQRLRTVARADSRVAVAQSSVCTELNGLCCGRTCRRRAGFASFQAAMFSGMQRHALGIALQDRLTRRVLSIAKATATFPSCDRPLVLAAFPLLTVPAYAFNIFGVWSWCLLKKMRLIVQLSQREKERTRSLARERSRTGLRKLAASRSQFRFPNRIAGTWD
jgi:hypothetical protein